MTAAAYESMLASLPQQTGQLMSARYLFPCPSCEHQIELVTKQAGQDLTCSQCNSAIEAPKLGILRNLELVGGQTKSSGASGSRTENWLFVGGLALAILAGAAGAFVYNYGSGMRSDFDLDSRLVEFDRWADELTTFEVVATFERMQVDKGLGDWQELEETKSDNQGKILQTFSYGLMGLAGAGVLMLVTSLFMMIGKKPA